MKRRLVRQFLLCLAVFIVLEILLRILYFNVLSPRTLAVQTAITDLVKANTKLVVMLRGQTGESLNRAAWQASYTERHLPIPPLGPREGYWGSRLTKRPDSQLGWREQEVHIPDILDLDSRGFQEIRSQQPPQQHVLILGASVAFGAYASSIRETYFAKLTQGLENHALPIRLTIMTAGGWESRHELMAFLHYGRPLMPDVVLLLDGLNDLTERRDVPMAERVADYIANVRAIAEISRGDHVTVVVALQPSLTEKPSKTALESRVSELVDPDGDIARGLGVLRKKLEQLQAEGLVHFIDCSRLFNVERATTFADLWHFSDAGHALLARELTLRLLPILTSQKAGTHAHGSRSLTRG